MSRTFTVEVTVTTHATDDELFAAALKTYEGHYDLTDAEQVDFLRTGALATPEACVADLVFDTIPPMLSLVDSPPAVLRVGT